MKTEHCQIATTLVVRERVVNFKSNNKIKFNLSVDQKNLWTDSNRFWLEIRKLIRLIIIIVIIMIVVIK